MGPSQITRGAFPLLLMKFRDGANTCPIKQAAARPTKNGPTNEAAGPVSGLAHLEPPSGRGIYVSQHKLSVYDKYHARIKPSCASLTYINLLMVAGNYKSMGRANAIDLQDVEIGS